MYENVIRQKMCLIKLLYTSMSKTHFESWISFQNTTKDHATDRLRSFSRHPRLQKQQGQVYPWNRNTNMHNIHYLKYYTFKNLLKAGERSKVKVKVLYVGNSTRVIRMTNLMPAVLYFTPFSESVTRFTVIKKDFEMTSGFKPFKILTCVEDSIKLGFIQTKSSTAQAIHFKMYIRK